MTAITETAEFTEEVFQLETTTPVIGGPGGASNAQAVALANRTAWLKLKVDGLITDLDELGISDVTDLQEKLDAKAQETGVDVGDVKMCATSTVPDGWLECNGALLSRVTYSALFAKIGTMADIMVGPSEFRLPDARGEFIRGWDHGRGVDVNRQLGSQQRSTHLLVDNDDAQSVGAISQLMNSLETMGYEPATLTGNLSIHYGQNAVGSFGSGAEFSRTIRPRNIALMFCIKY